MKRVIALGFFDGVHLGHAALLNKTVGRARELGAVSAACTFDVHPLSVLGTSDVPLLSDSVTRKYLMHTFFPLQDVLFLPFTPQLSATSCEEFVENILVKQYGACHLVAGESYRFGKGGAGDAETLKALCAKASIGCDIIPAVLSEGVPISSSHIRELLLSGQIQAACQLLGHPHFLHGTVEHGKKLGSFLGFPTVNLAFSPDILIPAFGVYASKITLMNGDTYLAATNIGIRPTVNDGEKVTVESFLLDFDGDLYGKDLFLSLCHRLRPERAFPSLEALQTQITKDIQHTRAYLAQNP